MDKSVILLRDSWGVQKAEVVQRFKTEKLSLIYFIKKNTPHTEMQQTETKSRSRIKHQNKT